MRPNIQPQCSFNLRRVGRSLQQRAGSAGLFHSRPASKAGTLGTMPVPMPAPSHTPDSSCQSRMQAISDDHNYSMPNPLTKTHICAVAI